LPGRNWTPFFEPGGVPGAALRRAGPARHRKHHRKFTRIPQNKVYGSWTIPGIRRSFGYMNPNRIPNVIPVMCCGHVMNRGAFVPTADGKNLSCTRPTRLLSPLGCPQTGKSFWSVKNGDPRHRAGGPVTRQPKWLLQGDRSFSGHSPAAEFGASSRFGVDRLIQHSRDGPKLVWRGYSMGTRTVDTVIDR